MQCTLQPGDGTGGTEERLVGIPTVGDCIRACAEKMKTDTTINGVTVFADNKPGSSFFVPPNIH